MTPSTDELIQAVRDALKAARDFAEDEPTVSWFAEALSALDALAERLATAERERDDLLFDLSVVRDERDHYRSHFEKTFA